MPNDHDAPPTVPATRTDAATSAAPGAVAIPPAMRTAFSINPANALALYSLRPGQHLSDYSSVDVEIHRVATGGLGLVFFGPNAHDNGAWAALKTLRPELLASTPDPARLSALFLREALTWVGLWPHANLLLAQYAVNIHGVLFLLLDYAQHGNLRGLLEHLEQVTRHGRRGQPGRLPLGTAEWCQVDGKVRRTPT